MAATDIDKLVFYRRGDDADLMTLVEPTTAIGANSTGSALAIPIGFTFHIDGVAYTSIDLFAYGFARFAGSETSANGAQLFAATTSVILAPWWDNLETADTVGYVKYEMQFPPRFEPGVKSTPAGTEPWRRFVIEWYVNLQAGQTGTDYDRVKFQLVLYETSDRFDFRYGTISTAGSPSRASYSAAVGMKGVTSVDTDNYRDFSEDLLDLGASNTTTNSNIDASADWPTHTKVAEPAWPMCGRAFLVPLELLTGMQDPYAEPIWYIANFVNWLMLNHRPALVDFSPWQEAQYQEVSYALPCTPSEDGLTYDVYVQTYSAGGDLRIVIDEDIGTYPDPTNDAVWNNLVTEDAIGAAAGWREWTVFQITPSVGTRALRVTASHESAGTILLGSVLIVPEQLDDIDIDAYPASGARAMSIAQLRQEGAAVHPEWYNRARATIRALLLSRKQMLWSSIWPDSSKATIAATTARPSRVIGIAPASLSGWPGQTVMARTIAHSVGDGVGITLAEDGGAAASFSVPLTSAGYSITECELELVSDEPMLRCTSRPNGNLSPIAVCVEWAPDIGDVDLIPGMTPAPRLEYLFALAGLMRRALTAYAMTGIATAVCRGKSTTSATRLQWQVPPGVARLRPKVVRVTADTGAIGDDTTIYAYTSGLNPADQIVLAPPATIGRDDYPPEGATAILLSSLDRTTSPIAPMDRLMESPTSGLLEAAVRERVEIVRGSGMTLVPVRDDPTAI